MEHVIKKILAIEILNSKRKPTVEVQLTTNRGIRVLASAPSGTSKGKYEAHELYDGGQRYHGFGTKKAVDIINTEINDALIGLDVMNQKLIDETLIHLDGTKNKERLGGNSILATSIAAAKAGALAANIPVYRYIGGLGARKLPDIASTVISGGAFSPSGLEFEDYILILNGFSTFSESLEALCDIRYLMEKLFSKRFGGLLEDGGALAAPLSSSQEAFDIMLQIAREAGCEKQAFLGLDVAASELYDYKNHIYNMKSQKMEKEELIQYYVNLCKTYPLIYIEDGFEQDDFKGFAALKKAVPGVQIVGDDLFVTNIERLKLGIEHDSANTLLFKINQIGTVTEAIQAALYAKEHKYDITASLRSGETNDEFQADLAVGIGAKQMKLGTPGRGERNAKYNRLLAIEQELI